MNATGACNCTVWNVNIYRKLEMWDYKYVVCSVGLKEKDTCTKNLLSLCTSIESLCFSYIFDCFYLEYVLPLVTSLQCTLRFRTTVRTEENRSDLGSGPKSEQLLHT